MKQFAKKYKGFTVFLIIEAAFLIFMFLCGLHDTDHCDNDTDNCH